MTNSVTWPSEPETAPCGRFMSINGTRSQFRTLGSLADETAIPMHPCRASSRRQPHRRRQPEFRATASEAAVVETGDGIAIGVVGVMQRVGKFQARRVTVECALENPPIPAANMRLRHEMPQYGLHPAARERVLPAQHPFQFQHHALTNRERFASFDQPSKDSRANADRSQRLRRLSGETASPH